MKIKGLGKTLLAIWLIAKGLIPILNISIPNQGLILNILALIAGIFLLLDREIMLKRRKEHGGLPNRGSPPRLRGGMFL